MNKITRILLLTDACFIFAAGLLGPIYAIFVSDVGGNILDAGWAWAAFTLTTGVVIYLLSKWENRHKHFEQLVIGGYVIRSLAIFGYLFVGTPLHLMLVQVLLGLGEAFTLPAYDALFTMSIRRGEEALTWGKWESMDYIVSAKSAVIGSLIATFFGFRALFLIMFAMSIMGVLLSIRLVPKLSARPIPLGYVSKRRK